MTTVLVVDDDHLMRVGLIEILGADPELTVVGHADSGTRAIELARITHPDIVLMDVRMANGDGITATRAITAELATTRVVVLTTFDQDDYVFEALEAGASGFLLKRARPEELIDAIHLVASGEAVLSPAVTRRVIERLAPRPRADRSAELAALTVREREVLQQIATGRTNTEIATTLFIEESTVRTHVKHLFQKLQLRDRVHAVIYAYEHDLGPNAATPLTDDDRNGSR
ncbi:MAG: response regulator transcription factor [Actinomycetota bacterium]|nr:response regulator transcription factor [Actinomycetota bacterium]